ncbi:NUDIX hydrolase [Ruegeria sp. Ofav3-42]|uniref:NUDIX hydrolase n=1 Tax=Ruegeria sp. Ofav3-42 TaxID=2917759 RepID=UPI001EF60B06|nr:NUDIX domain-containing protein [Ruegeria sp. Ofav3-42]MCG7521649.1 NUDIX domain-containing protein [Ruegeria sp. Ofav3-42]
MTFWRPHKGIRVKAIGLHWRGDKLLAAEVPDDTGRIKGVRPLGGSVEFGETWHNALKREFREELDVAVEISGQPMVIENLYQHEGHQGHEVIFVAEVTSAELLARPDGPILFAEDNGMRCTARWFDPETLDIGGPELYPTGLKERLVNR